MGLLGTDVRLQEAREAPGVFSDISIGAARSLRKLTGMAEKDEQEGGGAQNLRAGGGSGSLKR